MTLFGAQNSTKGCIEGIYMHSYGFDGVAHVEIAVGALARYVKYTFRTTAGVTSNHYQYSYASLFGAQNSFHGCI